MLKELVVLSLFVFLLSTVESNKQIKKVLSIVKDIKNEMVTVDEIVDALAPIIEESCSCCNEKPQSQGIIPPENFEVLKPITFDSNGEEHEQAVYYNDENKEAILYSPAHSGYPAITTVLTSKNGTKKAKSLTCDDDSCHLNDVLDELYLDPEIIAHVYKLYENSTTKSNKVRVVEADGAKINYVVRSNHQAISESEQQELPESMKAVSSGKMIFVSDVTIENERPDDEFTFDNNNTEVQKAWCGFKYGCGSTNQHGCSWSFDFVQKPPTLPDGTFQVHNVAFDRYCIICCGNPDSFPDNNDFVLCDRLDESKYAYLARRQAFSTAVALTFAQVHGPAHTKCADLYPVFKPGCKTYGNGQNNQGLGACVLDQNSSCP